MRGDLLTGRGVGVLAVLAALAGAARADSDDDKVSAGSPAPAVCRERLARAAHRLTVWKVAWGTTYLGATAVQAALIPAFDDRDTRIDLVIGAGSTLIGFLPVLLAPSVEQSPGGSCADVERELARVADAERAARGPWMHAGNVALNVGLLVVYGLYDHWASGALNALAGLAVGEATLLTLPVEQAGVIVAPVVWRGGGGLVVSGTF